MLSFTGCARISILIFSVILSVVGCPVTAVYVNADVSHDTTHHKVERMKTDYIKPCREPLFHSRLVTSSSAGFCDAMRFLTVFWYDMFLAFYRVIADMYVCH